MRAPIVPVVSAMAVLLVTLASGPAARAQQPASAAKPLPQAAVGLAGKGLASAFGSKAGGIQAVEPEAVALDFARGAALDSADIRIDDGSLADLYVFEAARGDTLRAAMAAEAFTPYLALGYGASTVAYGRVRRVRPLAEAVGEAAAGRTAALTVVLPADGTYTLLANAAGPGQAGPYTLEAHVVASDREDTASDLEAKALTPRLLDPGAPAESRLTDADPTFSDATPYQTWLFEGTAGETVRVTMQSAEVDPYLLLAKGTPSAARKLAENDDAPDARDGTARIEVTLPATGTYTVYANAAAPATGTYRLTLETTGTKAAAEGVAPPPDYAARYPGGGPPDGRYALLVGISEYPPGATDLATPVLDAQLMRAFLVERMGYQPEHVVLLADAEATREHILQALGRHLGQAGPDGTTLFYYSGHGSQTLTNEAIGPPLDAEPDRRDETLSVWSADGGLTAILDDEVRVLLDALPARRKLLVFDACHSGTAARGAFQTKRLDADLADVADAHETPTAYLTPEALSAYGLAPKAAPAEDTAAPRPPAALDLDGLAQPFVLLSGSESDQSSYTYTAWPERPGRGTRVSVFTYFLLDALEAYAEAPKAGLTFAALMDGVRAQTEAFMAQHRYDQTPHVSGPLQSLSLAEFFGR